MFYELVATLFAGLAMAGVVMMLNHATRGRLPKWAMPVGAGLAMIAATIASEYAWYDRTVDAMPEGLSVIMTHENRAMYRPWTYAVPFVDRYVAVDDLSQRTHPEHPNLRIVDTLFMGRWSAPEKLIVLVDCATMKRAQLMDGVSFGDGGAVDGVSWIASDQNDPLIAHVCASGVGS